MSIERITLLSLALAITADAAHAQSCTTSYVVAKNGSGGCFDFTEIWQAEQAASDGDTILVRDGFYQAFSINAKQLTVAAEPGNVSVIVAGSVRVTNLPLGKQVVIDGLTVVGVRTPLVAAASGVLVRNSAGSVSLQDLTLGGGATDDGVYCPRGQPGLWVDNSSQVSVVNAVIVGGSGQYGDCAEGDGGPGVFSEKPATQLALWQCQVAGGAGATNGRLDGTDAGDGGAGYRSNGIQSFFAQMCQFQGGDGGDCLSSIGAFGLGAAGMLEHGITNSKSIVGTAFHPGLGGCQGWGRCGGFAAPTAFAPFSASPEPSAPVRELGARPRSSHAPQRVVAASSRVARLIYAGEPGDQVLVDVASTAAFVPMLDQASGVWHLGPTDADPWAAGTIAAADQPLAFDLPLPELDAGSRPRTLFAQARFVDARGRTVLGAPIALVVLPDAR